MSVFYTVSKINEYISKMFDNDYLLKNVALTGEISSITKKNENFYLSIKDDKSSISAVAFTKYANDLFDIMSKLEVGCQIETTGSIKVYKDRGSYQLYIRTISEVGVGDIYKKFLQVFSVLKEKGYFDESYKKQIPKYAQRIGVVTASTGAALQDIKKIAFNKNPHVEIILCPSLVQGNDAKLDLIKSMKTIDTLGCDVVIVGRGGGSKEDLAVFNDEEVAMAMWHMKTPVISAVGHEIDTSITDFIADKSAPTPTAGSDMAVFDYDVFLQTLEDYIDRMDAVIFDMINSLKNRISLYTLRLEKNSSKNKIDLYKQNLIQKREYLNNKMRNVLDYNKSHLSILSSKIDGLSPLKRIYEGYSYITNDKGKNIKSIKDVKLNESISARVSDGFIISKVLSVKKNK